MRISIITESKEWICRRAAEELCSRLPNCQIDGDINKADIVYLMPYTKIGKIGKVPGKLVSLFTHYEKKDAKKATAWLEASQRSDAFIFMSWQWQKYFFSMSYVKNPHAVIHWASDLKPFEKTFGFIGHARPRKNPHYAQALEDAGLRVIINGPGWLKQPHELNCMDDQSASGRRRFYELIDYLVVSSSIEGGPVPVLDAIASGVPVIAPNVGWCWEYPCIPYDGTQEGLLNVCKKLAYVRQWADYAHDHRIFFEGLIK